MAGGLERLNALKVKQAKKPGLFSDGGNLYLQVSTKGGVIRKSWIFRYSVFDPALEGKTTRSGNPREPFRTRAMGLGSVKTWTLSEAREEARKCRQLLDQRIDPIQERHDRKAERAGQQASALAERAKAKTFKQAAEQYIETKKEGWKSAKHKDQWASTLQTYAYSIIGSLPVQEITPDLVVRCLQPIWTKKPETARRVRQRIERVMNYCIASKLYTDPNPAQFRGLLENLLADQPRGRKNHPYLEFQKVPEFFQDLRAQTGDASEALQLVIFTAARTMEMLAAKVQEIDFTKAVWVVPPERTKTKREYRVPLVPAALEIFRKRCEGKLPNDWVFPGRRNKPLSNGSMLMLLERMKRGTITVHGFRSSFRSWSAEKTAFPREIAEMCLGHLEGSDTERAYQRSDVLEKRRQLLLAWSRYCMTPPKASGGEVVSIRKAKRA